MQESGLVAKRGAVVIVSDEITPRLRQLEGVMHDRIQKVMQYEANVGQNQMRTGAQWVDRTGNARQGLFAKAGRFDTTHYIVMYHTVPYGIWLEVSNTGKYAIILPTIRSTSKQVMSDLRKLLRK